MKNLLRVFRLNEVVPGISVFFLAALDSGNLNPLTIAKLSVAFLAIFFSGFLINEYADSFDTDLHNPERQKGITNHGVSRQLVLWYFFATSAIGLMLGLIFNIFPYVTSVFVLLVCYSLPPVRLKAQPILDLITVTLAFVIIPYLTYPGASSILTLAFFSTGFWAIDLVAEGADAPADQKAGLLTTAVWLGPQKNILSIKYLAILSTILGLLTIVTTSHWWYFYLVVATFFLATAAQFGQSIVNQPDRLHELLRTGEHFGIFLAKIGSLLMIIILAVKTFL